jgi:hypothetical protein
MIPLTILSLDTDETVRNLRIEFFVALLHLVAHNFKSVHVAIFSEVESTTVQRKYANTHHFQK